MAMLLLVTACRTSCAGWQVGLGESEQPCWPRLLLYLGMRPIPVNSLSRV